MDKQQAAREAFEKWARASMKAGETNGLARKESGEYLWSGTSLCWDVWQAARSTLTPALVEARDALQKAYAMLVKANLKEHSEENQRCGRCDYCEALLPNADDDDCGECYGIVQALARLNTIIGEK